MTAGLDGTRKWLERLVKDVARLMEGADDGLATVTLEPQDLQELRELWALVGSVPDSGDPLRIHIQRTDDVVQVDGRPVRRWRGQTVGGVECDVYVALVRVRQDQDTSAFEQAAAEGQLVERPAPPEAQGWERHDFGPGGRRNGGPPGPVQD